MRVGETFDGAIRRAEEQAFVGREQPLSQLLGWLREAREEPRIVSCVGVGGLGKSTLAQRFSSMLSTRVAWVHGERLAPNPKAFDAAIEQSAGIGVDELGRGPEADVLVVDAFERISPLEDWIFDVCLPRAGAQLLVLITSRAELDTRRRAGLGFASLHRELRLDGLNEAESRAHLENLGVPAHDHEAIVRFSGGLPLALTLIAARYRSDPEFRFEPAEASDVVSELVGTFLRDVPDATHRRGLFTLCVAHALDRELLGAVLDAESSVVYDWLRRLPFVSESSDGLHPHAQVRTLVHRSLTRDYPRTVEAISTAIADELIGRMESADINRQRELFSLGLYAHRHRRLVRDTLAVSAFRTTYIEKATPDTYDQCAQLVEKQLGADALPGFRHWLDDEGSDLFVLRDDSPDPAGLIQHVALHRATRDPAADPLAAAAVRALSTEHEQTSLFRIFITRDGVVPSATGMMGLMSTGPMISTVCDAFDGSLVFVNPEPEAWMPLTVTQPLEYAPGHDLQLGGRTYGCFVGDISQIPSIAAYSAMLQGFIGPAEPTPKMTAEEVRDALREALRELHRASALTNNPLVARAGSAEALATWIRRAIESMADNPAYADSATVLRATYVDAKVKQEAIAESLGVPLGTYRYRLRKAIAALGEIAEVELFR